MTFDAILARLLGSARREVEVAGTVYIRRKGEVAGTVVMRRQLEPP